MSELGKPPMSPLAGGFQSEAPSLRAWADSCGALVSLRRAGAASATKAVRFSNERMRPP